MDKRIASRIATGALVAVAGLFSFVATDIPAHAQTVDSPALGVAKTSDSDFTVALVGYDVEVANDGTATATSIETGATEALPTSATSADGNRVGVQYAVSGSSLRVHAVSVPSPGEFTTLGIGNCIAGIGGGAVSGGTAAGLAGAAVGTVTLPIVGTVGGGLVGAIGGAVGGGLTGGATFC
ncbi:hypothetical protein CH302_24130 [Rhodococcus sp. 15-2388-1-1a]|uniref:hypothetical protein n=1 Tax=Nocardiaceae TaxID=85025 RepID=UPI0005648B8C|nr:MULTISPECIES: hypothetical protein [Rhodococcus]OZE92200.1 hypothetical protein CH302_24130 [Rhodococcus sp. 15-2388-1-1a]